MDSRKASAITLNLKLTSKNVTNRSRIVNLKIHGVVGLIYLCLKLSAVHVRCSTRSSTSTQIGASKMNRLLFTLTVVVLMAAHGEYCATLEFER